MGEEQTSREEIKEKIRASEEWRRGEGRREGREESYKSY